MDATRLALEGEGAVQDAGLTDDLLHIIEPDSRGSGGLDGDGGWFEFNDKRVTSFPRSKIAEETFGGGNGVFGN